jgi:hypothetical protein
MANIFDVEPNKVCVDLSQYGMVWIGKTGDGKTYSLNKYLTSISTDGKKPLFLMFESRYRNIAGIMAIKISSIPELKQVIAQLKSPKAKEMYSCVVIDTMDKCEEMMEQYTVNSKEAEILADVGEFGKGFKYFNNILRLIGEIRNAGFITHVVAQAYEQNYPKSKDTYWSMKFSNKKSLQYITQDAFLVGLLYMEEENGITNRYLTFQKSYILPDLKDTFGLPSKINLDEFESVLTETIQSLGAENLTTEKIISDNPNVINFKEVIRRGEEIGGKLFDAGIIDETLSIIKTNIGVDDAGNPKQFKSLIESQVDLAQVVVMELEELAKKHGLFDNIPQTETPTETPKSKKSK